MRQKGNTVLLKLICAGAISIALAHYLSVSLIALCTFPLRSGYGPGGITRLNKALCNVCFVIASVSVPRRKGNQIAPSRYAGSTSTVEHLLWRIYRSGTTASYNSISLLNHSRSLSSVRHTNSIHCKEGSAEPVMPLIVQEQGGFRGVFGGQQDLY